MVDENAKEKLKNIILELEHDTQLFKKEEVIEKAIKAGVPEAESNMAFQELIHDNYIHQLAGPEGLYARTVWRDYSPAFEDTPEF